MQGSDCFIYEYKRPGIMGSDTGVSGAAGERVLGGTRNTKSLLDTDQTGIVES